MDINIIYQDKDLVVCVKPAGLLSEEGPGSLPQYLKSQIGCEIYPVHRLDRGTGGIMVYAKTKDSAAALSAAIQSGSFGKEYMAIVRGVPKEREGVLSDLLYHDRIANKSYVVKKKRAGVKSASLEYSTLANVKYGGDTLSLLKIKLHTGRTHQIRVQFASRRLPLYGDGKYGGRSEPEGMALWAHTLNFFVKNGQPQSFSAPLPDSFPWAFFTAI